MLISFVCGWVWSNTLCLPSLEPFTSLYNLRSDILLKLLSVRVVFPASLRPPQSAAGLPAPPHSTQAHRTAAETDWIPSCAPRGRLGPPGAAFGCAQGV